MSCHFGLDPESALLLPLNFLHFTYYFLLFADGVVVFAVNFLLFTFYLLPGVLMSVQKYITILFVFTALLWMSACKAERTVIEETPPIPEQAIEKFTITETEKGKLKMILESESAVINEEKKTAVLQLPRVKFYKEGEYASTLIAESADIDLDTYDIFGKGKCTIETANNEYLQTRDLSYNARKELIYSVNDVKITTKSETITGKGFESDTKLEKVIIKKQKVILDNSKSKAAL